MTPNERDTAFRTFRRPFGKAIGLPIAADGTIALPASADEARALAAQLNARPRRRFNLDDLSPAERVALFEDTLEASGVPRTLASTPTHDRVTASWKQAFELVSREQGR